VGSELVDKSGYEKLSPTALQLTTLVMRQNDPDPFPDRGLESSNNSFDTKGLHLVMNKFLSTVGSLDQFNQLIKKEKFVEKILFHKSAKKQIRFLDTIQTPFQMRALSKIILFEHNMILEGKTVFWRFGKNKSNKGSCSKGILSGIVFDGSRLVFGPNASASTWIYIFNHSICKEALEPSWKKNKIKEVMGDLEGLLKKKKINITTEKTQDIQKFDTFEKFHVEFFLDYIGNLQLSYTSLKGCDEIKSLYDKSFRYKEICQNSRWEKWMSCGLYYQVRSGELKKDYIKDPILSVFGEGEEFHPYLSDGQWLAFNFGKALKKEK